MLNLKGYQKETLDALETYLHTARLHGAEQAFVCLGMRCDVTSEEQDCTLVFFLDKQIGIKVLVC